MRAQVGLRVVHEDVIAGVERLLLLFWEVAGFWIFKNSSFLFYVSVNCVYVCAAYACNAMMRVLDLLRQKL